MNVEWRKISDWRNWRLPVKLGVVLLVPVVVPETGRPVVGGRVAAERRQEGVAIDPATETAFAEIAARFDLPLPAATPG